MYIKKITIPILLIICNSFLAAGQRQPFFKDQNNHWVDSIMNKLSLEEKIAQLFMIQAYSNKNADYNESLLKTVEEKRVGGIIFMQGSPTNQAQLSNSLQSKSRIPLLMAIDAENGLSFRLDSTINYPNMISLGAIEDDTLIYKMGLEIGKQLRLLGLNMNLAPVSDININPENPVISYRSFGEDKIKVAKKAWLYAQGMQDAGVIATAKHFPGHGDTKLDSHFSLPIINKTKNQLDSTEFYPFKYLINKGISAIMTGHLHLSAYDNKLKLPATLSYNITTRKLKEELGFRGLIITDAMNMKGLGNSNKSGENAVMALKAGNDIIEIIPKLDDALKAVKNAVNSGNLSIAEIDEKCRKILLAKYWISLQHKNENKTNNIQQTLNENNFKLTQSLLFEKSLTVLKNQNDIIPLKELDKLKIASVTFGEDEKNPFQVMLAKYTEIANYTINSNTSNEESLQILAQLSRYNLVIFGITETKLWPSRRYGITDQQIFISEKLIDSGQKIIAAYFGNPYSLKFFPSINKAESLIISYQDDKIVQELTAQLIFGAIGANGKLPVSISTEYPLNSGLEINPIGRLKYTIPEESGINSKYLNFKIDSLVQLGISKKAFPGCQVLISVNGKIILEKSFGYHTYENKTEVTNNTLYDLASITKISGALPVLMKLYDEKAISLNKPIVNIFPEFEKTDKSSITLKEILTHTSRLQAGIPIWLESLKTGKIRQGIFNSFPTEKFSTRVSSNLYLDNSFKSEIIAEIAKSKLRTKTEFHYSDPGFAILPTLIERVTSQNFIEKLDKEFIKPLGATTLCYNPYKVFQLDRIAPSEFDQKFRKELIHGYVHDEMAAMQGGISGNAGLFGTANDLAKLMQMYLQKGYYGGMNYISEQTIHEFTKNNYSDSNVNRALGFDKQKPISQLRDNSLPVAAVGKDSYGHTGFTGTFVWNDPKYNLIFIFLSNRIYPNRNNVELSNLNIRSEMQKEIYKSLLISVR